MRCLFFTLVTMSLFPPFLFLSLAAAVCHTMGIREISPCRTSLTPEWRINCSPPEARIRRISTPLSSDRARFMKNKPRNLFYRFCGFQENFSDTEKLKIIPVPLLTLKVFRCALNFTSGSPTKNRKQADFQIVQITQLLGYQQKFLCGFDFWSWAEKVVVGCSHPNSLHHRRHHCSRVLIGYQAWDLRSEG